MPAAPFLTPSEGLALSALCGCLLPTPGYELPGTQGQNSPSFKPPPNSPALKLPLLPGQEPLHTQLPLPSKRNPSSWLYERQLSLWLLAQTSLLQESRSPRHSEAGPPRSTECSPLCTLPSEHHLPHCCQHTHVFTGIVCLCSHTKIRDFPLVSVSLTRLPRAVRKGGHTADILLLKPLDLLWAATFSVSPAPAWYLAPRRLFARWKDEVNVQNMLRLSVLSGEKEAASQHNFYVQNRIICCSMILTRMTRLEQILSLGG